MQTQSSSTSSSSPAVRRPAPARGARPSALGERLDDMARHHGFDRSAVEAMWKALVRGRGGMAQFDHPEFGGSGQWLRGGMVMIGDMFNRGLAARVGALADDLAQLYADHPELAPAAATAHAADPATGLGAWAEWWPAGLHSPAASGAQNGVRYAWFPLHKRLAIERDGAIELYDTQDHLIGGVSQQQGAAGTLCFTSQHGPVDLTSLRRVPDANSLAAIEPAVPVEAHPPAPPDPAPPRDDVLDTIARLAELHQRGALTEAEFMTKKAELLGRL